MSGEIIRKGDPTSHGGTVLEGSMADICHGKPIAYIGHKVHCPKCRGDFPIVEGVVTTTFYGKGVAIAGMKTACGATLVPTQFTDTVEYGGAANVDKASSNAGQHNAAAVAGQDGVSPGSRNGDEDEKQDRPKSVKRLFWTFGESETPLDDVSRHYVDLNLHIETENYAAGELVEVTLANDDGTEILNGMQTLTLKALVGANGVAKIREVFKEKTVEIGTIG